MKFGMNIQVSGNGDSAIKFLGTCAKASVEAVRLTQTDTATASMLARVAKAAADLEMKVVVAGLSVDPKRAEEMAAQLVGGFDHVLAFYRELAEATKPKVTLGIVLPEGLHHITKVSQRPAAFGLRREQIRFMLDRLINQITLAGHVAVMPHRLDDVQGKVYEGLGFGAYELDGMLSSEAEAVMTRAKVEGVMGSRPYWFGRAGMLGGYVMPAHQARFLRRLADYAAGAEFAFLWSEEASERWAWSRSGEMLLELMPGVIAQAKPVPLQSKGRPEIAHWKARRRLEAQGRVGVVSSIPEAKAPSSGAIETPTEAPASVKRRRERGR